MRVWTVKNKAGSLDYFTSAKKAMLHCEFWIGLRGDDIDMDSSDNLKSIKNYGFGWITGKDPKNYFTIDSHLLR